MEELISKGKEFLGIGRKKPRKKTHYEFRTDPTTGIRSNKGTYSGQFDFYFLFLMSIIYRTDNWKNGDDDDEWLK